jgi:transposase
MTAEEQKRMEALEAENAKLRGENTELQDKLLAAQQTLAKYAKMLFGQKTERCRLPEKPEELTGSLFQQEMDPQEQARLDAAVTKALDEQDKVIRVAAHERKVRKAVDTSRLEVKEEHLYPELENAEDYTEMAPEITDSLVLVPRQMYIRRIIRHKYVLKGCLQVADPDRKAFRIAALPPAPLHKCMADASLLADIVISKYVYHLPFYRVIETYKELGVSISASTINDWFKAVVGKVKPLYDLLRAHVLACDYVQVDESTLPVIDNEKHRAVKGYVWSVVDVMAGDRFFFYEHGSRSTRVAMGLLKDFRGAIQSDGYIVYEHFEGMDGKLLLGCWAHARRKFFDARVENEKMALEALFYIRQLYDVEDKADALDAADGRPDYGRRKALRKKEAYPEIKKFETWMEVNLLKCPPKSLMEEAISYTYKILKKLSLYTTDGRYKIDDNMVENSIRPLAIGRKNYLFCGDDDAAQRAAVVYSLLATCKAHGVNERAWLEDVLRRIPEYELGAKDYADLLPGNWSATSAK